jgi:hypothetical protein
MIPIKATESLRVVIQRNSLEKLRRLESMGKKPLERQYPPKGREKASRKNTVLKELSLEKAHTSKI